MTNRTLLSIIFIALFKSTFLFAQQKSISEWKDWNLELTIEQFMGKDFQQQNLGLTPKDDLAIISYYTDEQNIKHVKLQQLYEHIPVDGAVYMLHQQVNKGTSSNGLLVKGLAINTDASILGTQALTTALDNMKADTYAWEVSTVEQLLKHITNDTRATYYPKGELVITGLGLYNHPSAYRLAYRFDIYAVAPMERYYVYVDAHSGQFIKKTNRIYDINQHQCSDDDNPIYGNGMTRYYNQQAFRVGYNGTTWQLSNDAGVMLNGNNSMLQNGYTNFINTNNLWIDTTANTAFWLIQQTHDYFLNNYNRNGYDNNGTPISAVAHFGQNISNAGWNGNHLFFGNGNAFPYVTADIVAHEWTHALIEYTANLVYEGESGAINEALCDIFGVIIEDQFATNDWIIASEINGGIRNLANPNAFNHPDTYLGNHWYSGVWDNGGVHTNSGVLNYWFYLLSQGGSGTNDLGISYQVNGIGIANAAIIVYKTLTDYLTPNAQYADVRLATLQAAATLYGSSSTQYQAVAQAWCAVGLGGANAAFTYTNTQPSLTANFTSNINDASLNYTWNFGDGNSSTLINPIHTYSNDGVYDVQLTVSDICGMADTTEQVVVVTTSTACLAKDSLMLVRIYNATNGSSWTTPWNLGSPLYFWDGIVKNSCSIIEIDLANKNLTGIIPNIKLNNLEVLDLAKNQLIGISNFDLPNLKRLYIDYNLLTEIPELTLPNLEHLRLTHNQLNSVPSFNLPNLKRLYLTNNQLNEVPNFNLPSIIYLYLDNNQLTEVPNFKLLNLENLYLSHNQLTEIPNFDSKNLIRLYLDYNNLVEIPNLNLPMLLTFHVRHNKLIKLPNLNLVNLSYYHLYNNKINFSSLDANYFNLFAYYYTPQDSIETKQVNNQLYVEAGGNIANNTYKWYKNNALVATVTGDSTYIINSKGHYRCEVTNSIFTTTSQNLILRSKSYHYESCIAGDSTALIQIYNATNGSNWTTPWNTANPVTTWQKVYFSVDSCGIDSIDLRNQNLQGIIPDVALYVLKKLQLDTNSITELSDFQHLDSLNYLSADSNQIDNLPTISHLSALDTLHVRNNQLTFGDLIPYAGINDFQYAPQDSFALLQIENELIADVGDVANCTFYWYKNGALEATIIGNSHYTIATTGYYQVKVTNSVLTQLTLWSQQFLVTNFCTANFSSTPNIVCEGTTVNFVSQGTAATYDWQLDGQNLTNTPNFGYTFSNANSYEITLTTMNGSCTAIHKDTIIISPNATIDLAPIDESICAVPFMKTLVARQDMAAYQWSFNGQVISNTKSCTATQHGIYTINATDICGNTNTETTTLFIDDACYVWAGDCNNDGIVNEEDWLTWGLMFGDAGQVRKNATTAWQGQLAYDFDNNIDGINSKYGDTNGDGIVNFADTIAIVANFGMVNPNYAPNPYDWDYSPWRVKTKIIGFDPLPNNKIKVSLGIYIQDKHHPNKPLALHGLNLDIDVATGASQYFGGDADFTNSPLGIENQTLFALRKNQVSQNRFRVACTRIDKKNGIGNDFFGKVEFIITEPVSSGDTLQFRVNIHDVHSSQGNGYIHSLRPSHTGLVVIGGTNLINNFAVETNYTPTSCSEGGTATANPVEALNPPYTYLWSNGDTSQTITDLEVGDYSVLVTNAFGNTGFGFVEIEGIDFLQVIDTVTTASNGQANGAIQLNIQGGSGNYTIRWDNDDSTLLRANLAAGNYIVTVTDDSLGCAVVESITVGEEGVPLSLKVFVEGAFDGNTGLMYDSLRTKNLLPLNEPFTRLGFNRLNYSGEQVDSTVFNSGVLQHNDIVDWILVELRDKDYPNVVVTSRAALLQRDGDIVGLDGLSPLTFSNIIHKSYYIAIKHRNHLGIMTNTFYALDENGFTLDFTNGSVATYGTNAQKNINGTWVMFSGDNNSDGKIDITDKNKWQIQNGSTFNYYETLSDFNIDGQINAVDKNLFWTPNNTQEAQIPD